MNIIEKYIAWFKQRKGKVTYSMINRTGSKSYDCSSAVYYAVCEALGLKVEYPKNTASLPEWLLRNGFERIAVNCEWTAKRGDIVIWAKKRGVAGAEAHTAIFVDNSNLIHCNYNANGISENSEKSLSSLYSWHFEVFRLKNVESEDLEVMNRIKDEIYTLQGSYSIDSMPWWADDKKQIGTTNDKQGMRVTVTRKWGNYWYCKELGGFIDYRAFTKQKDLSKIAKEVINGDWGNGEERKTRLEKAGYNYAEVQKEVNKLV